MNDSTGKSINQMVMAKLHTHHVIAKMRNGKVMEPIDQIHVALQEAISDARTRLNTMIYEGHAGSVEFMNVADQIGRWSKALKSNR